MRATEQAVDEGAEVPLVGGDGRAKGVGMEAAAGLIGSAEVASHSQPVVDVHGRSTVPAARVPRRIQVCELVAAKHFRLRCLLRESRHCYQANKNCNSHQFTHRLNSPRQIAPFLRPYVEPKCNWTSLHS